MFFDETKPFGVILGLLGNVCVAVAMSQLIGLEVTDVDFTGMFLLPLGIILTTAAMFLGGGWYVFHGMFLAVGIGALVAGGSFGQMFGGIFIATELIMGLSWYAFWGRFKTEAPAAANLGARGTGTVVSVTDTGMTINDNPRVQLVVRIQPENGAPAWDATKAVVVSRVAIPRAGDRMPVFYDPGNPTQWGYGAATPALP